MFISGHLALKNGSWEMSRYTSPLARHDMQGHCRKMRQFWQNEPHPPQLLDSDGIGCSVTSVGWMPCRNLGESAFSTGSAQQQRKKGGPARPAHVIHSIRRDCADTIHSGGNL